MRSPGTAPPAKPSEGGKPPTQVDAPARPPGPGTTQTPTPRTAPPATPSNGGQPPTQVVVRAADGGNARTVRLKGSAEIGRRDGCAVRLSDTYVSQVHARLY